MHIKWGNWVHLIIDHYWALIHFLIKLLSITKSNSTHTKQQTFWHIDSEPNRSSKRKFNLSQNMIKYCLIASEYLRFTKKAVWEYCLIASEYLRFTKKAVWVLKIKIFGQKSTYSKETTVVCEFIHWHFVKNRAWL